LFPKRDIDFSIDLVTGVFPVSKTPYRMGTILESKELEMQLEDKLKEGEYMSKHVTLGSPCAFCEEKR
jgi:hypothetical protein